MFKRSLASLTAVVVVSGAVVAPANAMTTTVNNDMCTITPTDEEARLTSLTQARTLDKKSAALIKKTLVEGQLSALEAEIAKYEQELAKPGLDTEESERLRRELEKKRKQLTAYKNFSNALEACAAGNNYDSNRPSVPKRPEGSDQPSVPKQPEDSVKPDDKRALPSNNGAVIGVIVAVLGILAAALPVIKSILRALLP